MHGPAPLPPAMPAMPAAPVASVAALPDDGLALIPPLKLMDLLSVPAAGVLLAAAAQPAHPELEPRSAEAWQAVVDAAGAAHADQRHAANPALARGRADWLPWAEAMREGAAAGAAAARRRDPRGLYAAGQQLRAACQGCHASHAARLASPAAVARATLVPASPR